MLKLEHFSETTRVCDGRQLENVGGGGESGVRYGKMPLGRDSLPHPSRKLGKIRGTQFPVAARVPLPGQNNTLKSTTTRREFFLGVIFVLMFCSS